MPSVPKLVLDQHHARMETVRVLNTILGLEPRKGKRSSRKSSRKEQGALLWSPRIVSSPRLMDFISRKHSSSEGTSPGRTLSDRSEDSESVNESSDSPLSIHSERELVVKYFVHLLASKDDLDDVKEDEGRSIEQVRASLALEHNPHRERDYAVLALMGGLTKPKLGKDRSFGSVSLPMKTVKQFEESLEHKYGSNTVASSFLSLWTVEFGDMFLQKCFAQAQQDDVEKGLIMHVVTLFSASNRAADLVKLEITNEMKKCEGLENARATLFRSASLATSLFSCYYHNGGEGIKFLNSTAGPLVKTIMGYRGMLETTDSEKLKTALNAFFNSLDNALQQRVVPKSMIEVLKHLNVEVSSKFASMARPILCVFLFVRFFCPVIVSPHAFGMVSASSVPSKTQQKNLILVSKLLSNIASGVRFDGTKEERMSVLNGLIDTFGPQNQNWLDKLLRVNVLEFSGSSNPSPSLMRDFGTLFRRSDSSGPEKFDSTKSFDWLLQYVVKFDHLLELNEAEMAKVIYLKNVCAKR
jgi:hypothetical protein